MNRRKFVWASAWTSTAILTGIPLYSKGAVNEDVEKLTILHTNDVHSRIDPFPMDGGRFQGLGGAAKRAALINKIRQHEKNVLLLDSGDFFQGTPYFNMFGGEVEIKLMSEMGYDAACIGNHDFDAGIDGLVNQLKHSNFPLINANYDLDNTDLKDKVKPYTIFKKGEVKIGVFGLGIELEGLVPKKLYGDAQYNDPIQVGQNIANILRNDEGCDLVICLSHLGYKYDEDKVSDQDLARQTSNIDLILGGHTHSFLNTPDELRNKAGDPVVISQVGWAGILLGRLDIYFEKATKNNCIKCKNNWIN